jgi:hypothetical protein
MKATKKPVTVECVKWDGENLEEVKNFCGPSYIGGGKDGDRKLVISTLEGDMLASVGDFIIKGVKGEFYPCKPDIFEQTYDIVEVSLKDVKFNGEDIDDDQVRFLGAIDCKKCPAKETCTVDYWIGCGDNFMEWAKSEATR